MKKYNNPYSINNCVKFTNFFKYIENHDYVITLKILLLYNDIYNIIMKKKLKII